MVIRLEEELGIKVGLSDWDKFYQALTVFKQIKNSMKVLARFTIPAEEPWPEDLWNYRLGVRVGNLRTTGRFLTGIDEETKEERVAMLDEIGFEWKPRLPKKSLVRREGGRERGREKILKYSRWRKTQACREMDERAYARHDPYSSRLLFISIPSFSTSTGR